MALLKWMAALFIGGLGLWRFHIAQFSSGFDTFPGDRGDGRLLAYICEHWYQVLQGKIAWRSPAMFYPIEGTLGYTDMFLASGVASSVLRAAGLDIFTSLELVAILFNYLSYVFCFILLYRMLRLGLVASSAGAFFFAYNSPKLVQMGHLQLHVTLFVPLSVICVLMLVQKRETISQTRAFGLLSLAVTLLSLQLMSGYYPGWFFIFWSFLFLALSLLLRPTRTFIISIARDFWRPIAGGMLLFIVEMIPFLLVYVPVIREMGWRPYGSAAELIPVPAALLVMGNANYVWGDVSSAIMEAYKIHPELQIGVGLVPSLCWLALTVAAILFIARRFRRRAVESGAAVEEGGARNLKLFWLSLLVLSVSLFYLIGMKLWDNHSPWAVVFTLFPGAKSIRGVSRYVIMLTLPMAVVFAFLIQYALRKILSYPQLWKRAALLTALFALIGFGLFEQLAGSTGFSIKAENYYLERLAQKLPEGCGSFYLKVGPEPVLNQFEYQIDAMMVSQMRNVPTVNGYSGVLRPDWFPGLWEVKLPGYEESVRRWIERHGLGANVCRLLVDESVTGIREIDQDHYFVRQLYLDILSREPDPNGFRDWHETLKKCPEVEKGKLSPRCDRAHAAAGFFRSSEFGINYFIYYFYRAAMGRAPASQELNADRERLKGVPMPDEEGAMQKAMVAGWIARADFKEKYDGLRDEQFVDVLMQTGGVSLASRNELVEALKGGRKDRADVLREFLNSPAVSEKFYNAAFVFMQYDRLLKREPDEAGYLQQLSLLERTNDYRRVTDNFINMAEYRNRFKYFY